MTDTSHIQHDGRPAPANDDAVRVLMRRIDWRASPVGAPETWSESLKATVGLMLPAHAQIVLFWGPEYVALYNDAYAPTIGDKHPRALGRPAVENWAELWHDLEPLLRSVRDSGETVHAKDRAFYIERHGGRGEEVFFDISYSAVPETDGSVGGVLCIVSETTERVRAERALRRSESRLRLLGELDEALRASSDAPTAMLAAAGLLARRLNVSRCAYADVDADSDRFFIRYDYTAPGVASSAGSYSLDLFGPRAAANMRGGRTLVVNDVVAELAPGEGREMFQAIGIDAIICCPLVKNDRLVAMMAVHNVEPRSWEEDEVDLVQTVVERCWAHVERVGAEARLRESEGRYQAIVNSIDQMIWSTRPDGHHDYFNDRWYEFTGVPYGSTDGEGWNGMFHPDDQPRAWEVWRRSLDTGEPYHIQYRLRHRSGSYRWVIGRAQCVRDDTGRIVRWFGTCTDIDELKVAQEQLRDLNESLETRVAEALAERKLWADVFKSTDALIGALSVERRFLALNQAYADEFERIYGVRPKLGDDLADLLAHTPEHQAALLAIWDRALAGETFTATDPLGDPNRARPYYELRFNTLEDRSGRIIGAFQYAVDITERLRREAELAQAQEALRQSQKMETVGQLTGGVAHDFNNLLQIVTGNLDTLQRNLSAETPRLRRAVDNAMAGAQRAVTLTQRLLAFSRRQPLAPKPVDLNKLVGGMSELLHRTLGETIELETVLASGLWRAEVDPNQLENAVLNLAVNARDAMPQGGKLTVETSNTHLDRAYAAANAEVQPGQYVLVCVSDTGTGMDEATVSRVFEPFFTTKEVGRGTGLGLSMVYGFVKQSGGHVQIYSEPGHGTTVKLYLPRLHGPADVDEPQVEDLAPEGSYGETILVCEDDDDVREYSVEALRELGYRVLEAHDAASALRLLERQEGRVDLLFSDVVLPGRATGAELASEARRLRPGLKVLFTSGYARDAIIHQGRLEPGVELLTKPFTFVDLAARVRDMLDL